jgi:beta-glucosidase
MNRWMLLAAFVGLAAVVCFADEESSSCCGRPTAVMGEFSHFKKPGEVRVVSSLAPEVFADEIWGPAFNVVVPNLAAATYTVELDFAEVYNKAEGARVFSVRSGEQVLAENLDIFKAAGGFAKPYRLTTTLNHAGDALRGPLTISFQAKIEKAKLNALTVRDATGKIVAGITAASLTPSSGVGEKVPDIEGPALYTDPDQPVAARVNDLLRRLTIGEKARLMNNTAQAVPRLSIPQYDYWNECLHGVARAGVATVFPQAIGMAATWDTDLIHDAAEAIGVEARAKHHQALRDGNRNRYFGLTFWTPNINIFRDPRWGRGQETYGEDPFLTGRLGVSFIRGLQGDDPHYARAMACAKHYAVHSGPEPARHVFDAVPPERDLYETYLPHFEAAVREGGAWSVMGAYNRTLGEPCCSSELLLKKLLREEWGFRGHVVSDCGAIHDIWASHKVVGSREAAAARAVKAGCDLCCGGEYAALPGAVRQGLITEKEVDAALYRVLEARFILGMFDPPQRVPYAAIPFAKNDCPEHSALAARAARECMVLLKNDGVLPLDAAKLKKVAVIGANADSVDMQNGNYNGKPSHPVTILQGIRSACGTGVEVVAAHGCPLAVKANANQAELARLADEAVAAAQSADVVIYVGGLSPGLEGEEMPVPFEGFHGGDRTAIELPTVQQSLLEKLKATGKPVVFVNCSGSAVAMPWAAENLPAILQAWYPGQAGGAVADVLFGVCNPSGRLPVTFYRSTADLPAFDDYAMANRTYRYFGGKPLFAFGHGLSYTKFDYGKAAVASAAVAKDGVVKLSVDVKNAGERDGEEVVQVYFRHKASKEPQALRTLCAFRRSAIPRGESRQVAFEIPVRQFRTWNLKAHAYEVENGPYELLVGASSSDIRQQVAVEVK